MGINGNIVVRIVLVRLVSQPRVLPISGIHNYFWFNFEEGQSHMYRCDMCLEPEVQVGTS